MSIIESTFLFHPEGKSKKEKGMPIQRSTETGMAVELPRNMSRQPSRESNNGSMNSCNSEGKSVTAVIFCLYALCGASPRLHSGLHRLCGLLLYCLCAASMWVQYWDHVGDGSLPLLVRAHKSGPFRQKPNGSNLQK